MTITQTRITIVNSSQTGVCDDSAHINSTSHGNYHYLKMSSQFANTGRVTSTGFYIELNHSYEHPYLISFKHKYNILK